MTQTLYVFTNGTVICSHSLEENKRLFDRGGLPLATLNEAEFAEVAPAVLQPMNDDPNAFRLLGVPPSGANVEIDRIIQIRGFIEKIKDAYAASHPESIREPSNVQM